MTRRAEPTGADLLVVARSCYGWLLACAPRRMIRLGTPQPAGAGAVTMTRVLGARHLLQALVTATAPSAGLSPDAVLAAGAAVDAVHAGSMIVVAVTCRPLRRVALADAALEASLGAFGIITARRPQN
ncbi:MAG TPA: hypothetical protein VGI31_06790 [Streptosporangiaceae bacterium]